MRDSPHTRSVKTSVSRKNGGKFCSAAFLLYCCVISLLFTGMVNGQSGKISGFLYDSETGDPLPSANIFLSKTTLGTTSDPSGYFELRNIPPGQFVLVFRFVGYSQKSFSIEVQEDEEIRVNDIHLGPDPIELNKIDVISSKPVEWMRNLEQFKNAFLGETENALRTEIKNPEILNLYKDPDNGELIAESPGELHVINRALGYELFITLDSFPGVHEKKQADFILMPVSLNWILKTDSRKTNGKKTGSTPFMDLSGTFCNHWLRMR